MSDGRSGELRTAPPRPHSASGSVWEPQRSVCVECVVWMEVMGSTAGDALGLNASWLFQLHRRLMMETLLLWFLLSFCVNVGELYSAHLWVGNRCALETNTGWHWRQSQPRGEAKLKRKLKQFFFLSHLSSVAARVPHAWVLSLCTSKTFYSFSSANLAKEKILKNVSFTFYRVLSDKLGNKLECHEESVSANKKKHIFESDLKNGHTRFKQLLFVLRFFLNV